MKHACVLMCAMALVAGEAKADYILTPMSGGQSTATVNWGNSITIDFLLSSDSGDVHGSAIFQVILTEPGLIYQSYHWSPPFADGPPFDDSTPITGALPALLDEDTLSGAGRPSGVTDVELSNVLIGSDFGEGLLVSMELTVPPAFGFTGPVYIAASPDTFADGFDEIATTGGQVFELSVVPEPASGALLLLAATGLAYRRLAYRRLACQRRA